MNVGLLLVLKPQVELDVVLEELAVSQDMSISGGEVNILFKGLPGSFVIRVQIKGSSIVIIIVMGF